MKLMKKSLYSLLIILTAAFVFSCEDTSLDPLRTADVKKGTILALRGQQLQNIYYQGLPGAEFFPRIITGTETFDYDAEFLAEDPTTLESFDIYVIKKVGSTTERVFLKNIPGSDFKETSDYVRPWVSVSLKLTDILEALDLADYTDPAVVDALLSTYKFGVNMESDLNLKDGTVVPAADIVAAGLFQSNQFYPAQKLTYNVTDFCVYDASTWAGTYAANEVYSSSVYGPYSVTFVQDVDNPNKFTFTNFWDYGLTAYVEFTAATDNPDDQIVVFPDQDVDGIPLTGSGTYDQCLQIFKIQTSYDGSDWRYEFAKQ